MLRSYRESCLLYVLCKTERAKTHHHSLALVCRVYSGGVALVYFTSRAICMCVCVDICIPPHKPLLIFFKIHPFLSRSAVRRRATSSRQEHSLSLWFSWLSRLWLILKLLVETMTITAATTATASVAALTILTNIIKLLLSYNGTLNPLCSAVINLNSRIPFIWRRRRTAFPPPDELTACRINNKMPEVLSENKLKIAICIDIQKNAKMN